MEANDALGMSLKGTRRDLQYQREEVRDPGGRDRADGLRGWLDSEDVVYYHYDTGEPALRFGTWYGTETKKGKLVLFESGDRLRSYV